VNVFISLDERILRKIGGVIHVANHAIQEEGYTGFQPLNQRFKRMKVAGFALLSEFFESQFQFVRSRCHFGW
jgi:hypothetical protein